jgi:hypothetical protein
MSKKENNNIISKKYLNLDKEIIQNPYYIIGLDTSYDKDSFSYCLFRKVNGITEILLSKTMRDQNEFNQEVNNLAKYFNYNII